MNFGKILVGAVIAVFCFGYSGGEVVLADVYICKGPQSKRYHLKSNCRGLSRCSTQIYKVSIEEARNIGRTLCGWED